MEKLLLITYPATLPEEGNIADENSAKALTNHLRFEKFFVVVLEGELKLKGWKVENIGFITYKEAKKNHEVEDGEPVEITEGEEWGCDEKGRWATTGLLARLHASRYYRIEYGTKTDDSTALTIGHTNEHHIAQTTDNTFYPSPFIFEETTFLFAESEKEIKEAKESDGGWVPIHEDLANGHTGHDKWITKDLQARYLEFETQKKARGDEQGLET